MALIGTINSVTRDRLLNLAVWCAFAILALNVLVFTLRAANPTLMADDWYFLDVFGRKAIDHTLTFADFFVRRAGSDHSEPFIKLVILWCLDSFHLDLSVEAIVGVFVALAYALLFRFIVFRNNHSVVKWAQQLAWLTIAAALLSLNSTVLWSWAENSMQYSSDILIPAFLWAVWRAYTRNKYVLLPIVTLFMAVLGDDNGIICVVATFIALGLYLLLGKIADKRSLAIVVVEIFVVMLVVRVGYRFAPIVGGMSTSPLDSLHGIYAQISAGHWHEWIEPPVVWGVVCRSFLSAKHVHLFKAVTVTIFVAMLALHIWFWVTAFRSKWNPLTFVAVCLMLVVYGWIAGILIYRAPLFGAVAFSQPRYVRLYEFEVISLALMWLGTIRCNQTVRTGNLRRWIGTCGCIIFLVLQIPLSVTAWHLVPYIRAYYQDQARQTYKLAVNPVDPHVLADCNPQLHLCKMPLLERTKLIKLVRKNNLSIFSGEVVRAHPLLLSAASSLDPRARDQLLSGLFDNSGKSSLEVAYGQVRSLVLGSGEGWPGAAVRVDALRPSVVPLVLSGCWPSDRVKDYVSSWCGPDVSVVLQEPHDASVLHIQGWFPWNLYVQAGRSSPVTITVSANGVVVAREKIATDKMFQIDVPGHALPDSGQSDGLLFITISSDGAFVPSHFLPSKDSRDLSMKLSSVRFLPAAR